MTGKEYKKHYNTATGLKPPSMLGRKWINDGKIQKKLAPGEPLPDGWSYGRLDMSGKNNPMNRK